MGFQHIGCGIKGFYRVASQGLTLNMKHPTTSKREQILAFWDKYGVQATCEAFAVSRRTLFRWKALRIQRGNVTPISTAAHHKRKRLWPMQVHQYIRKLRTQYPNLGKTKIYPLLDSFCQQQGLACPSVATIGRLIADAPDKMRQVPQRLSPKGRPKQYVRKPKPRKPKGVRPAQLGEVVALDTIERVREGMRRYILTLTDVTSRVSLAFATRSHSSQEAKRFFQWSQRVFPGKQIVRVLSDNGSEFAGAFAKHLASEKIPRWYTYPKTPKMNAHAERFNRTVQEEFVDYHEELLFTDVAAFNDQLAGWLIWFNTKRPHHSLDNLSPLQYIVKYHSQECQLGWTHTVCSSSLRV